MKCERRDIAGYNVNMNGKVEEAQMLKLADRELKADIGSSHSSM